MTDKEFKKVIETDELDEEILPNGRIIKSGIKGHFTRRLLKARKATYRKSISIYKKFMATTE